MVNGPVLWGSHSLWEIVGNLFSPGDMSPVNPILGGGDCWARDSLLDGVGAPGQRLLHAQGRGAWNWQNKSFTSQSGVIIFSKATCFSSHFCSKNIGLGAKTLYGNRKNTNKPTVNWQ